MISSANKSSDLTGLFVENVYDFNNNLTVTLGARQDSHSKFGDQTVYRSTFAFRNNGTTYRGSYGTGYRAPSLYELFAATYGNENLKPETSQNIDLGFSTNITATNMKLSGSIFNNTSNKNADIRINIFNPSGDQAEACGNGTRCVAKMLFNENNEKETLMIQSDAGILIAKKVGTDISVNMGKLTTSWNKIPLSEEMDPLNIPIKVDGFEKGVSVNIGNPHIVFFGKSIDSIDLESLGPAIENHKFFPNKTNVEFVEVINSKKKTVKLSRLIILGRL